MLSDGGNSRLREEQIDTDSAEPPSVTEFLLWSGRPPLSALLGT